MHIARNAQYVNNIILEQQKFHNASLSLGWLFPVEMLTIRIQEVNFWISWGDIWKV